MKILIVEDEPKTAAYLKRGLEENRFIADLAEDGDDGAYLTRTRSYDLIILDVMLPARDGFSIIARPAAPGNSHAGAVSDRTRRGQ